MTGEQKSRWRSQLYALNVPFVWKYVHEKPAGRKHTSVLMVVVLGFWDYGQIRISSLYYSARLLFSFTEFASKWVFLFPKLYSFSKTEMCCFLTAFLKYTASFEGNHTKKILSTVLSIGNSWDNWMRWLVWRSSIHFIL